MALGEFFVTSAGLPGRRVLTVFGPKRGDKAAEYYPYDPGLVFSGPLAPPDRPGTVRVLALDGVEVEAAEAGTVSVPIGSRTVRLVVRRIPTASEDESELEIYFRDATNGEGTYPAGRFVAAGAAAGRSLSAGLQPRAESVLRLQLGVPLSRAVAREHHRGAGGGRRALQRGGLSAPPAGWRRNERGRASGVGVHGGFVPPSSPEGRGEAALDLAGGELRFGLTLERREGRLARRAVQR